MPLNILWSNIGFLWSTHKDSTIVVGHVGGQTRPTQIPFWLYELMNLCGL